MSVSSDAVPARRGRRRSLARHRVEHGLFLAASALLSLAPGGSAQGAGRLLSRLYFSLARSRKRILLDNLAAAFPQMPRAEIRRIGRACVENFGATVLEFLGSHRFSREDILSRVSIVGEQHFAAARARGKGVFILSAHLGSWELGALRAGMISEPISPVVRPLDNPLLEEELALRRTRFGNRVIAKRDAAREILRAMRRNETVAILVDQNVIAEEAVFVPFFGRLAATTPSLALLQMKTDAAVVPVFTFPMGKGRYSLEFEAPILAGEFADSESREERVRRATARFMEVTERAIRRDPAAWLWIHNRWRTRPGQG